jgi:hypothetical protein
MKPPGGNLPGQDMYTAGPADDNARDWSERIDL